MANFSWQTEDDVVWDDLPPTPNDPPPTKKRWPIFLVMVLLASMAGGVVYWQMHQQIETAAASVTEDIQASYDIVVQANATKDEELFVTILSGRDKGWSAIHQAQVEAGTLFDRSLFGLTATDEYDVINSELAPDMLSAEFVTERVYETAIGQSITLQQTDIYRLGSTRWLLAPPLEELWGERQTTSGTYLSITHTERETDIAQKLLTDLDALVNELCQLPDMTCPADFHALLVFSTDLHLLYEEDVQSYANLGVLLSLPSPLLVGIPVDDAGQKALVEGYSHLILPSLFIHLTGYRCCELQAIHNVLLEKQMAQLNLSVSTTETINYGQLLRLDLLAKNKTPNSQNPTGHDPAILPYLVDFLHQKTGLSLTQMQLALGQATSYGTWLSRLGLPNDNDSVLELEEDFLQFLAQTHQPDSIDLPQDHLYLQCLQDVYEYDWQTGNLVKLPLMSVDNEEATRTIKPITNNHLLIIDQDANGYRLNAYDGQTLHPLFDTAENPEWSQSQDYTFKLFPAREVGVWELKVFDETLRRYTSLGTPLCDASGCTWLDADPVLDMSATLTLADFEPFLPTDSTLHLSYAKLNPYNDDLALALVQEITEQGVMFYWFGIDLAQNQIWQLPFEPTVDEIRWTVDGRYLISSTITTTTLYDPYTGRIVSEFRDQGSQTLSWSSDGYLALLFDGYLLAFNPDTGRQHLSVNNYSYCSQAVWVGD